MKCVVLFVIAQVWVAALADDGVTEEVFNQKFMQELPCLSAGGLCVRAGECPRSAAAALGLCPSYAGYECCYSLPLSERRCRGLGGECLAGCAAAVRLPRATDCAPPSVCCRLE